MTVKSVHNDGCEQNKNKDNRMVKLVCSGLLPLLLASLGGIKAGGASTATLPISVRIIKAVDITVAASLDFGTIAITDDAYGDVYFDYERNSLIIEGNGSISPASGTPQLGRISVRSGDFPFNISLESTVAQLTNGVSSITIRDFNLMVDGGGAPYATIVPGAGERTSFIPLGASLSIKPGQLEGTYTGSVRVFANFQ